MSEECIDGNDVIFSGSPVCVVGIGDSRLRGKEVRMQRSRWWCRALRLFWLLGVFWQTIAVQDIELRLCKDICYIELLVLIFLLGYFFGVKECELQKYCEPREGHVLHILGKQS